MNADEKKSFLAGIKDPLARAHFEAQLEMAEEWDGEPAGGIFGVPAALTLGSPGQPIETGFSEVVKTEGAPAMGEVGVMAIPTPVPLAATPREPWLHRKALLVGAVVAIVVIAYYWLQTH